MTLYIPEHLLQEAGLTEQNIKLELAILLFQKELLTLGLAAQLAGLHNIQFQRELAKRKISIHYGEEELKQDISKPNIRDFE